MDCKDGRWRSQGPSGRVRKSLTLGIRVLNTFQEIGFWDFPGCPVVKTSPSNLGRGGGGCGFDPWLGS